MQLQTMLQPKPEDCNRCREEEGEGEGPSLECGPQRNEGEENGKECSKHLKEKDQVFVRCPVSEPNSNIDP